MVTTDKLLDSGNLIKEQTGSKLPAGIHPPRVAEFFAGIGLVRMALEKAGCLVVFANDINPVKRDIYIANFNDSVYTLNDIRNIKGFQVPDIDIATASFPCTDLSLAGNRAGLIAGKESSVVKEFLRVIYEMHERRPPVIMLENVEGFLTSNDGEDLRATIEKLNELGYNCDLILLDARRFVPQSRPRLFIVCLRGITVANEWYISDLRPKRILNFAKRFSYLGFQFYNLPNPPVAAKQTLEDVIEKYDVLSEEWWDAERLGAFLASLSQINARRLETIRRGSVITHATAYRRTRNGRAVWEIRGDKIGGCLRTAKGGSSRQAVVEAGAGNVRVRWMTAREYARLQGVPELIFGDATESESKFAIGDAVCVPAVEWLARHYLVPAVMGVLGDLNSNRGA